MKRRVMWIVVGAVLAAGGLVGTADAASEVDILLDKLVEKNILTNVEAGTIRQEIAQSKQGGASAAVKDVVPKDAQRITLSGDLRLREEYRDRTNASNANRQRMRFRFGAKAAVSEQLEVGARLVTGGAAGDLNESSEPVSTNQTFSDTFAKRNFNLDTAYVKYAPAWPVEGLSTVLWGGLFENPFVSTPLIWDGDLAFSGAATQLAYTAGPVAPFLTLGVFPIDSDGFGTDNPNLWAVQGGLTLTPGLATGTEVLDHLKVRTALAYYDYQNVDKHAIVNTQSGNTNDAGSVTSKDFNELNPLIELSSSALGVPVALWSDFVTNTHASAQDSGYQFGLKLGKASKPFSLTEGWEAGYFYERLEADAVFDGFADSDFGGGGTNTQGHAYWLTLASLKNSTIGARFINAKEVKGAKTHENRVQVDWVTKF